MDSSGNTMYPGKHKHDKGEIKMGINRWYMNESDETYSSYTDFTEMNTNKPVSSRRMRKTGNHTAASQRRKNRSSAGKVLLSLVGAMAIAAVSISGTWFYLTEIKDNDDLKNEVALKKDSKYIIGDLLPENDTEDEYRESKNISVKMNRKSGNQNFGSGSGPAYEMAEEILSSLQCDDDINTAWEIFNWVHSSITYQTVTEDLSYEDAAYRGFTRRSGDCYVYFACAKMLLDCAGIPNLMVERYPVITNGHYWNLVQIDGEWYHCDATVFRDHPDMYFLLTDEEIADSHHEFDGSLYPERASYCGDYYGDYYFQPGEDVNYVYDPYTDDYYYYDDYSDDYYMSDEYYYYPDFYTDYNDTGIYVDEWGW